MKWTEMDQIPIYNYHSKIVQNCKKKYERERERENNKKFIENNMRRKKVKIKNIVLTPNYPSHVMLCNKITLYFYILSL